jgi:CRISPR-associated protein Cas8a1/Csx13
VRLVGLAATVRAWQENEKLKPEDIIADFDEREVRLSWRGISDQLALRRILDASFKLTPDGKRKQGGKLIDLPGHGIEHSEDGLRLGGSQRFVLDFPAAQSNSQHRKRFTEHEPERSVDAEEDEVFTYKGLDEYAHRIADEKLNLLDAHGKLSGKAEIPQWVVPGAMRGAVGLEAPVQDVFLLLYLMTACAVYHLRPRKYKEKAQFCVVVPDVINLKAFSKALRRLAATGKDFKRFRQNYLNRVVGGAEEAALSFLIDLEAGDIVRKRHVVSGCLAIAMGRVAWDKQQNNRSQIFKIGGAYDELEVFKTARQYLSQPRTVKLKTGESFVFPASPVPELVAANLTAGRHWCANFLELVEDKKDFGSRIGDWKGLVAMKEKIRSIDDQTIVTAFHARLIMAIGILPN